MCPSFLISAASSNSGKTILTAGLLRALRNRGLQVQPFKCGPDYIDPMFHRIAAGRVSINLDTFMSSKRHVQNIYNHYSANADVRVIEGVMGLYDGYDGEKGCCAELSQLLNAPVVLVINAKSMAYSVAPLIAGFKHFRPQVKIGGVIFNMVASENHGQILRKACQDIDVTCFGCMPVNAALTIPSRHLGLMILETEKLERLIELAAQEVESHIDIDTILHMNTL